MSEFETNKTAEKVLAKEVEKRGEDDMFLTVVLKSKSSKTEKDFNNKRECYEYAENLLRQMQLSAAKATVNGYKQVWIHLNFQIMKVKRNSLFLKLKKMVKYIYNFKDARFCKKWLSDSPEVKKNYLVYATNFRKKPSIIHHSCNQA